MPDMPEKTAKSGVRRDVLKGLALGSLAAAALAAAPRAAKAQAKAKPETAEERKKARYKETEHVKAFYRTNRY